MTQEEINQLPVKYEEIKLNKRPNTSSTWKVFTKVEKQNENVPPKTKMISPKELGEAIDKAIEILKTLKP